eukprot:s5325_g1.t1
MQRMKTKLEQIVNALNTHEETLIEHHGLGLIDGYTAELQVKIQNHLDGAKMKLLEGMGIFQFAKSRMPAAASVPGGNGGRAKAKAVPKAGAKAKAVPKAPAAAPARRANGKQ